MASNRIGLVAALILGTGLSAGAEAQNFRLLSSWDSNFPSTKIVTNGFIESVKELSKGAMTLSFFGPETVPAFEQLQPVQSGAFQFLMSHGAYHYGAIGFGVATDALKGDIKGRRESGVWAAFDEAYQKRGMKIVAMPIHLEGYQIVLRRPLSADGDLKGMKIRATPSYFPLLESLGAVTISLPGGEVYAAFQKGVIDGAAWPVIGVASFRWYEVSNTLVRPSFGNSTYLVMMNLDAWKKLDADKQKVLLDAGVKIEVEAAKAFSKATGDEEKELVGKGMKLVKISDKHAAGMTKVWAEGVWSLVEKKEGDAGKALRAFARSKGMTD